jgi:hypothetical protein
MLEEKVERIAHALERLVPILEQFLKESPEPVKPAQNDSKPVKPAETKAAPAETITHADLKALCMSLVKTGKANKDQIKGTLALFAANTVAEVKAEDLSACKQALEALNND